MYMKYIFINPKKGAAICRARAQEYENIRRRVKQKTYKKYIFFQ